MLSFRPSYRQAATLAGLVAVASAIAIGTSGGGAQATGRPAATAPGQVVFVEVVSTDAAATEMTRRLRAEGLDIDVRTLPSTPSHVGTWLTVGADREVPEAAVNDVVEQTHGYRATLRVPSDLPGTLTLTAGRAPRPGEQVVVGGVRNALAPGGPFACRQLAGAAPARAQALLQSLGYRITGWGLDSVTSAAGRTSRPPQGTLVTEVFIDDADPLDATRTDPARSHDVLVQVSAPGTRSYDAQVRQGSGRGQDGETGC